MAKRIITAIDVGTTKVATLVANVKVTPLQLNLSKGECI
jgi:cell division ATPase FtsA